jgi:hypothetical protein
VDIVFWRDGKKLSDKLTIQLNRPVFEMARVYDTQPPYVCFAGLTFISANRNFLETWGREWTKDIPHFLRYLLSESQNLNTDPLRKEYVVLSQILPDQINVYDGDFADKTLEAINDQPIRSLDDVRKAFQNTDCEFYIVKFMNSDIPLLLDAKQAHRQNNEILKKYNVPAWTYPEEQL